MLSTLENPEVVDEYLHKELLEGRIADITDKAGLLPIQISPLGVIPKKHTPGKWRLIVDLSSPKDFSINDGIPKEFCSLSYVSVDDVAKHVLELGPGTRMAKVDIRSAYRHVPVHPDDRPLLGMQWRGHTYVDKALPFGLRSAPKIFNSIADALEWVIKSRGVARVDHYLDDFITVGDPSQDTCAGNLQTILDVCRELGITVAVEKCEGPTCCIIYLGIEIDSVEMEMRLPQEKLARLAETIKQWRGRKACTKRELLSLIGQLSHACKVVKPGRVFLSRMIRLSTVAKQLDHHVRLNQAFRSDLEWWFRFLSKWNGVLLIWDDQQPSYVVTSDASGSWGCGAFWQSQWFQVQWPENFPSFHITVKELIPLVIAAAVWGRQWGKQHVQFKSDNAAVVSIINGGYSKDQEIMHLMRCLHFLSARFHFRFTAEHIKGEYNTAADALSRDSLSLFQELFPTANKRPTPIPRILMDLLMVSKPDWTSTDWTAVFNSI